MRKGTLTKLENIFMQTTGIYDLPVTKDTSTYTRYEAGTVFLKRGKSDGYTHLYPEFYWFHEAYHYKQHVNGEFHPADDAIRLTEIGHTDAYYYIYSEVEANAYAYKMCKRYGYPTPDSHPMYPKGYMKFIEIRAM